MNDFNFSINDAADIMYGDTERWQRQDTEERMQQAYKALEAIYNAIREDGLQSEFDIICREVGFSARDFK